MKKVGNKKYIFDLNNGDRWFLVDNTRNYIQEKILPQVNFTDRIKTSYYLSNDGYPHRDYFDVSNIFKLYDKPSDHNWDKETEEIYPSEGSDKLSLRADLKRVLRLEIILMKNEGLLTGNNLLDAGNENQLNDIKNAYKTRGGSFFGYLVKSKVDLSKL